MSNTEHGAATLPENIRTVNVVTKLTQNDILLGRGAPIINYEGNIRFRALVGTRKLEYNSTGRHQIKDEIARQIVLEISRRNGRFLKKVESEAEIRQLGLPEGEAAWIIADEDVILEKVKQALRDKEPEKKMAQSESSNDIQHAVASSNTSQNNRGLAELSLLHSVGLMGRQLPLPSESVEHNSTSSLLSQLPYLNNQRFTGGISSSSVAHQQRENDIALLRQLQQQRQEQVLLSQITASPQIASNTHLLELLRQNNRNSLMTQSITSRNNHGARSDNASLSLLGVGVDRSNDFSSSNRRNQAQNYDELLALYLQNQNEIALANTISIHPSIGLSTIPTLNSLRDMQQYTNNLTASQELQRLELQRQILLDPNLRGAHFAESRTQPLTNSVVSGRQNNVSTITTSLDVGRIADSSNDAVESSINTAQRKIARQLGDAKVDDHQTKTDSPPSADKKRKSNNSGTESSESTSTILATTKKKPRESKLKK